MESYRYQIIKLIITQQSIIEHKIPHVFTLRSGGIIDLLFFNLCTKVIKITSSCLTLSTCQPDGIVSLPDVVETPSSKASAEAL